MRTALPTVLTSGTILITAGYIIGKQCSIYYISSIGLLISRGALMSVLLVLTLLPALLSLLPCRPRAAESAPLEQEARTKRQIIPPWIAHFPALRVP